MAIYTSLQLKAKVSPQQQQWQRSPSRWWPVTKERHRIGRDLDPATAMERRNFVPFLQKIEWAKRHVARFLQCPTQTEASTAGGLNTTGRRDGMRPA